MAITTVRFNCTQPGLDRAELSARYQAVLDICEMADASGMDDVNFEEHHGAPDGWLSAPVVMAAMALARTRRISATVAAILVPLHDPLRLAEDIAAIDLASGGRLRLITGLGYIESEYRAHRKDWDRRGEVLDETLAALVAALSGEPFERDGRQVQVTPPPLTRPHPFLMVGGASPPSARRAARFGLPFFPAANLPELEAEYLAECERLGHRGLCIMPPVGMRLAFVSEDPDRTWAEHGHHFWYEADKYAKWAVPGIHSAVRSHATDVASLREEGLYCVMTPDECIAHARDIGPGGGILFHPLCGGMPVDAGVESMRLVAERVMPALRQP